MGPSFQVWGRQRHLGACQMGEGVGGWQPSLTRGPGPAGFCRGTTDYSPPGQLQSRAPWC